ncbi:MAG TPA: YhdP family protein [Burkholderiales bacterium]|nr:YhdP family protein [Burkholderiales bacterium]
MSLLHEANTAALEAQLPPNERRWLRWLRRAGWALAALYFVVAIGMLALRFWVLPSVADHKERIAAAVSRALGEHVSIGGIAAEWFGLHPRLELTDVNVFDSRGEEALALPHVAVTVAWRSLIVGELRFRSIVVDRADLTIRRDPQGKLLVAGLAMKPDAKRDGNAADWLLKHDEIVIRESSVEWLDERRGAPPIRLERLDFLMQNDGRHHRFAFRAQLPHELASALELKGDLIGRSVAELAEWNGRVYAAFDYVDLAAWQTWVDYPFDVRSGRGALKLWLGFAQAALTEFSADVALADVATRLASNLPLLEVQTVRGQFGAHKRAAFELIDLDGERDISYDAFARQLALVMKNGTELVPGDVSAQWRPAQSRAAARGEVVARSIELAPLAILGEYLPFPERARQALIAMAPEGRLTDVTFAWTGDIEEPATYVARGKFGDVGVRPYGNAPGVQKLSGSFDASDKGGNVILTTKGIAVDYARLFPERTLAFDALGARVGWSFPQGDLLLRLDDIVFSNPDLAGTLSGTYRTGAKGVRAVDITARLTRAEGKHVYRYVPLLPPEAVAWLRDSIQSGTLVGDARFRIHGDPADFPFRNPKSGEFRISGRVTGGTLDYARGWPKLTNVTADLLFDGPQIKITSQRANVLGAQITSATVVVPDPYAPGPPTVLVDGEALGATNEFLKYIAQSPVRSGIDGLTDRWTAEGRSNLKLRLELPVGRLEQSKIVGTLEFADNGLAMGPGEPVISQLSGRVDFTESGVSARNLTGQTLGGSITAQITTSQGTVSAVVQGTVDAAQLTRHLELPLADRVRGPLPFKYTTTTSRGRAASSLFESPLTGVAVDLPPPFRKSAAEPAPMRIERTATPDSAGGAKDVGSSIVTVSIADLVKARAELRADGGRTVLDRAGVAVGDAAVPIPDRPGVFIAVNVKALDLDQLLPVADAAGQRAGDPGLSVVALSLRTETLIAGSRLFHDVSVGANFDGRRTWRADVTARELEGELAWRPETPGGQGAVRARLKHLIHPERTPGAATDDALARELPALFIEADSYTFGGHELGRLELRAVNEQRGWRLRKLELTAPEGTLAATGLWEPAARGTERTQLDVKADVKDVGKYLARFGYPETVARGTGTLEGELLWNGPVFRIDYGSLSGHVSVRAERGQFVKVDPGAARLLGVLSLQALPRRITLDFRDVFSEGFAFDSVTGTAKIARGVATTDDLVMVGPAASVAITGQADLTRETQDLVVRVVPTVGDGIAIAAGLALLNPLVGAGALLAQRLLRDPVGQMLAFEYRISGSWGDPKVVKVRGPSPQEVEGELGAPKADEKK